MAKITATDITDLGFIKEMFPKLAPTDAAFTTFINGIIAEQAEILEGLVGSSVYASTTLPTSTRVKRAERCLVAAEMVQRRINVILGNSIAVGQEIDISHEGAQKKAYATEAEALITKLGGNDDYAGGVNESSHFDDPVDDVVDIVPPL